MLPQATTGIAATAIFCLISASNEYAFALLLTSGEAQTAPLFIPIVVGEGGLDWPAVAAGTSPLPVVIFTVLLRQHLLRGITFGAPPAAFYPAAKRSPRAVPRRRHRCRGTGIEPAATRVVGRETERSYAS